MDFDDLLLWASGLFIWWFVLTVAPARADEPRSAIGFTLSKWQPITIDQIKQPIAEWHYSDGNHGAVTTEYRNIRPSSGCPIYESLKLVGYRFNCEVKNESVH